MEGLRTIKYQTDFGEGMLFWRGEELVAHTLPGMARDKRFDHATPAIRPINAVHAQKMDRNYADASTATESQTRYINLLESYFAGEAVEFPLSNVPLESIFRTPFQLSVIKKLTGVAYGQTVSYGGLAAAAGYPRAHRAVGNLMAANPLPLIVPCHRVLRGDGSLGRFSAGGEWKIRLLELEGSSFA